jgi:hypothetical protein
MFVAVDDIEQGRCGKAETGAWSRNSARKPCNFGMA